MNCSILVVEDSPTQAKRMCFLLEKEGYRVQWAPNGRRGLDCVRSDRPDLIISDVVMPEMDGYALCEAVKSDEKTRRIPFVLLTSQKTALDIITGLARGADNFITKPFEDSILVERVARIFRNLEHRKNGHMEMEVTLHVGGRQLTVNADKQQIIELLFSTFEELSVANQQLADSRQQLSEYAETLSLKVEERTRQLREAEAKYRNLVERVPAVIYTADIASPRSMLYLSPQMERLLGFSLEEWKSDPESWRRQVHPEDRDQVLAEISDSIESARPLSMEYRLLARDRRVVWVQDEAAIIQENDGERRLLQGVLLDITDRKRVEEALARHAEALERANTELEHFAYVASHDLQEPLRMVSAYVKLLEKRYRERLDEEARGFIGYAVEGAKRMHDLINDLLAYSRVGSHGTTLAQTSCEAIVDEVQAELKTGIESSAATLTRSALPTLTADGVKLKQVFSHLVDNALKFRGQEAPRIHISARRMDAPGASSSELQVSSPESQRPTLNSQVPNHEPTVTGYLRTGTQISGTRNPELETQFVKPETGNPQPEIRNPKSGGWLFSIQDNGIGIDPRYTERIFMIFQRLHARQEYPGTGIGLAICKKIVELHGGRIWVESQADRGATFYFTVPA